MPSKFTRAQFDLLNSQVTEHKEMVQKVWEQAAAMQAATESLLANIGPNDRQRDRTRNFRDLCRKYQSLTPREREVMAFVVSGLPNKQTAQELGKAEITVKIHRASVMKKMKANSLADLVRMAEKIPVSLTGNRG